MHNSKKRVKSSYQLKSKKLVPPTGSTFVNHTTVRNKVCNLGGYTDEKFFSNGHKKSHATFGKPLKGYSIKNRREFCYTSLPQVDKENEKHMSLEKIPSKNDKPLMNLKSNVNFIKKNQFSAQKLKPKKQNEKFLYTTKRQYGQVPKYLTKIQQDMECEMDYIKLMKEAELKSKEKTRKLSNQEIQEIRSKLQQKHRELTLEYQGIAHIKKVDSIGMMRKKLFLEKQLDIIEKDMRIMSRDEIFVELNLQLFLNINNEKNQFIINSYFLIGILTQCFLRYESIGQYF